VRWLPDVSFLASPNIPGYILCTPQNPDATPATYTSTCVNGISGTTGAIEAYNSIVGGTSVSAPVFAGISALLNQALAGPGSLGLGQLNPMLYQLAVSTAGGAKPAFNQTPSGSHAPSGDNIVFCQPGQPAAPNNVTGGVCPPSGLMGFSASGAGNFDAVTGYNLVTGLGSLDAANFVAAWEATLLPTSLTISASPTQITLGQSVTFTATLSPAAALGNVQFFVNNSTQAIGSAALDGATGTATFPTTALPGGTDTVNASYNGDGVHAASSTTTPATVTVIQPSFTLASDAATYTVTQGSPATAKITLTPGATGFTENVTYTCSEPANLTESTCVGPSGAQSPTTVVSFNITTTAATASVRRPVDRGSRIFYAALLPGLLGIVFAFGSRKRSLRSLRMLGLIMVLGMSTMWLGSCGGSNNSSQGNPGTPKGSYTITVSATSGGANAITGQTTFTLTVQ
jgi:hypothetical protein